jgi:broad specificity phosphatase PhoE
MTFLTLVRHGTTEWIEQGRLHGVSDAPLSLRGQQEARLAAQALAGQHFDAFYTSPLGRARATAAIIGQAIGLEPISLDDLRELNFGWVEGGQLFNPAKDTPLRRALRSTWIHFIVQLSGEPRSRFNERVAGAAREIAKRHPNQRVLAVIHMAVRSHMLACLVDGDPAAWARYNGWPAGAFTEIELNSDGKAKIIRLNDSDHLKTLRNTP